MGYKWPLSVGLLFCSLSLSAQTQHDVDLYDSLRSRVVPVTIYEPVSIDKTTSVIIFNHGYGQNAPDSYKAYSCLTAPLAAKGYYVISIQHELVDDPPLAMAGNFMKTRMPAWENGVKNIVLVVNEFKKSNPDMNWGKLAVIGHSNGGDMAMLFATEYPEVAQKVISLDHRRMIVPRCSTPRIYTLRGSDYEADENVIPTDKEQRKFHITVVRLDGIKHGDMDNKGTKRQHDIILDYLYKFLKE